LEPAAGEERAAGGAAAGGAAAGGAAASVVVGLGLDVVVGLVAGVALLPARLTDDEGRASPSRAVHPTGNRRPASTVAVTTRERRTK
jgi:hypothetical protein